MFKKLFILLLIVAPIGAFAQDKLAYINSQEIFYQMPEIKDVEAKITAKQDEIKKNLATMESDYTALQDKFKKDTTELTPSIIADRQKQMEQLQERYETYAQNSQKELQDLSQQLQSPLIEKLQKTVQAVGQEQGFVYILEKSAVPFIGATAVDAGKLVKAKLGIK